VDSLSLRRRVLTRVLRLALGQLGLGLELAIPITDTAIIPTGTIDRTPTTGHIPIIVGRHTTGITGIGSTATIVIITIVANTKLT
jgi:hypothetical protein